MYPVDLGRAVVEGEVVKVSKVCQPSLGGVTAIIQTKFIIIYEEKDYYLLSPEGLTGLSALEHAGPLRGHQHHLLPSLLPTWHLQII